MKPKLIVAMIAGGMTGVAINVAFDVGLRAPAAPGSIFAVYAQTASDSYVGVTIAVAASTAVTFAVAALLLKTDRSDDEGDLTAATASMESMKGKKSIASSALGTEAMADRDIRSIVFACDAGMGSSAMGASVLRKKIRDAGHGEVTVVNKAISNLDDSYDLVVSHQDLTDRARQHTPSAVHVSVDNFMGSPRYDDIVGMLSGSASGPVAEDEPSGLSTAAVLSRDSIVLEGSARSRDDAISEAGRLLVAAGAVDPSYVEAMHEREQSVSTHMGNGLAIPHGTNEAKPSIRHSALSFVRYADAIDWNGRPAEFVVGIAGAGDDHLVLLRKLATVFADESQVARLRAASSADEVLAVLDGVSV
jgi:PTS system mannitol-specific IIC component